MVKNQFKNIFQGSTVLILALILIMFVVKTDFDPAVLKDASVAAVPMGWNVDRLRSEIAQAEKRYENFYYDKGRDPNSNFMRRQEANIAAMKARQYDLEFQKLMGTPNPFPYKPENYTLKNFVSDGNPTPSVAYEPKSNISDSNLPINGIGDAGQSTETPWAEQIHHQGEPFGGLVQFRIECDCEPAPIEGQKYVVFMWEFVTNSVKLLKVDLPYTKFYLFYDLQPGQYGLGTYDMGGECYSRRVDPQCQIPLRVDGVINRGPGVGSSGIMPSDMSDLPMGDGNFINF